jgi:type I restriction enzyme S subunit
MVEATNRLAIRFSGFTCAWEQRTFDELVFRVSTASSNEPDLLRVEYEDIVSGQGQLNKDIYEKKSTKSGIRFEPGDVLFGKLRPYLQNWLLPDFTGIAVGDWWVLRPNDMNHEFIYTLIQSPKYQTVSNLSTGTKMPRSDWSVVSKTAFAVPSDVAEQTKIGVTFRALDRLITLHQREYEKLQNMKEELLEKMFVPAWPACRTGGPAGR